MRTTVTWVALAASILLLTATGGGLFPATVGIVATVLSAVACLVAVLPRLPLQAASMPEPQQSLRRATRSRPLGKPPFLEAVVASILLFVILTAIPLPPSLDRLSGPLRHDQNQIVAAAFNAEAHVGIPAPDEAPWFSISRNRAGTLRHFLLLAAAFSAFLLAASMSGAGKEYFLVFVSLLGTGVGIAGYIGQWVIPQGDTLWWMIPVPHTVTSPVGCFLNRNHFGGFVGMLAPVALALAHHAASRRRWFPALVHLVCGGVMMGVVFHSLSRGSMLAMGAGLAITALVIAFHRRPLWGFLLILLVATGTIAILSKSPRVRDRLDDLLVRRDLSSVQSRLAEWRESLRVLPDYPWAGAGMNALRMVYPQSRQTSVGARLIHAENEYVQLLAEGGLIGAGLTVALLLAIRRRIGEEFSPDSDVVPIAVAGALTVSAIHCFYDFPAHLPLYALVLGILAGLLLSPPSRPAWTSLPAGLGLAGALLLSLSQPERLKQLDDPLYLHTAKYRELNQALVWAPTSPAWLYLGRAMIREGSTRGSQELCAEGEKFVTRAAMLDPKNYRLWYELGEIRLAMKDTPRAVEAFQKAHELRSWMVPPIPGSP